MSTLLVDLKKEDIIRLANGKIYMVADVWSVDNKWTTILREYENPENVIRRYGNFEFELI